MLNWSQKVRKKREKRVFFAFFRAFSDVVDGQQDGLRRVRRELSLRERKKSFEHLNELSGGFVVEDVRDLADVEFGAARAFVNAHHRHPHGPGGVAHRQQHEPANSKP